MVQTITIKSDGSVSVNTGSNFVQSDAFDLSIELQNKFDQIVSSVMSLGASELHSEKDQYREFEHIVVAGLVSKMNFGSTVSADDFEWIMSTIDTVIAEEKAAILEQERIANEEAEALEAAASSETEQTPV